MEQKIGRANLARMEANGWAFHQNDPQNPDAYTFVGVSSGGTPVWLHSEVASSDLKITIGQAQANHWGAGGGGKLILPGVVSDATIESNHCAFVTSPQTHYGAYAGPMRSDIDEVATMCGLDCTMNVILDTHGRVIDCIFGSHPEAHREAIRRFNAIYAYDSWVEEQGQADIVICGVFAPTDHLFFHTGWGCMSADLVLKDGGTIIYTSPSPGVSTAIGDFPGFALMDLMKPYMPPTVGELPARAARHPQARDPDVGRLHLGADLRGDDAQAPDGRDPRGEPRDGGRHRARRDDVAGRGVRGRDGPARSGREGGDPAVRPLPAAEERRPDGDLRAEHPRARGGVGRRAEPSRTAIPGFRPAHGVVDGDAVRGEIRGSTTILEILRMYPDGRAATLMSRLYWPCAHCGGAVREPLTLAAQRHARDPRAVLERVPRARARRAERRGGRARRRATLPLLVR